MFIIVTILVFTLWEVKNENRFSRFYCSAQHNLCQGHLNVKATECLAWKRTLFVIMKKILMLRAVFKTFVEKPQCLNMNVISETEKKIGTCITFLLSHTV